VQCEFGVRFQPTETFYWTSGSDQCGQPTHFYPSRTFNFFFREYVIIWHPTMPSFWVLCAESETPIGFMGLAGSSMDALFLDPEYHRCGGGRKMVEHAQRLKGDLLADVNEQNVSARRFYKACGFVVEGRSEVDGTGRPFPLLHMRLAAR
jgi:putative acetyltransferase